MLRSVVAALGLITILAALIIVGVLTVNSLGAGGLGGGAPNQIDAAKHAKKQANDMQKKVEKNLDKQGDGY